MNSSQLSKQTSTLLLILCLLLSAGPKINGKPIFHIKPKRPALVVLIAVDGLGADIFTRYASLFTGGFRRLRERGMNFSQAMVNHAITISHPGHVTLSTGMNPARHGIVDAAFYQLEGSGWQFVDALEDSAEHIPGVTESEGVSPRKILVSALPEWIADADPQSRMVAVGSGQYSSLLHAGHLRGDVYWYMNSVGRFVTSTYYRHDYPEWIERFNREALPKYIQASATWQNEAPVPYRRFARRDDAPYEGYRGQTSFPHAYNKVVTSPTAATEVPLFTWFAGTPFLDAATLELAKEAVNARALGQRRATDYLSIVVSQVDDIGHTYGAGSQEQLDNLLRLDRELGDFFKFLDERVGKGNFLVALSADHAMMDIPEYQREIGQPGRRITEAEVNAVLQEVRTVTAKSTGTREEIAARIAQVVKRYDFVEDVMTPGQLTDTSATSDEMRRLYRNSYRSDRVPRFPLFNFSYGASAIGKSGVMVRLARGAVVDLDRALHGSPYDYDRHVPLLFMGPGVRAGSTTALVYTVDVAPTLARLAGIPAPKGLDGRPLLMRRARSKPG